MIFLFTRKNVVLFDDNHEDGNDNGKSQFFFFLFASKLLLTHGTIDSLCITIYIQEGRGCRTKVLWVKNYERVGDGQVDCLLLTLKLVLRN